MTHDATRPGDGALELRARAKAAANNSPYELELYLLRGGKLLDWYESVGVRFTPTETPADVLERNRARIMRACPPGLTPAEVETWVAVALAAVKP